MFDLHTAYESWSRISLIGILEIFGLPTERYHADSLEDPTSDEQGALQIASKIRRHPPALDYDCDYYDRHAD